MAVLVVIVVVVMPFAVAMRIIELLGLFLESLFDLPGQVSLNSECLLLGFLFFLSDEVVVARKLRLEVLEVKSVVILSLSMGPGRVIKFAIFHLLRGRENLVKSRHYLLLVPLVNLGELTLFLLKKPQTSDISFQIKIENIGRHGVLQEFIFLLEIVKCLYLLFFYEVCR